jgi:hypothetical protein
MRKVSDLASSPATGLFGQDQWDPAEPAAPLPWTPAPMPPVTLADFGKLAGSTATSGVFTVVTQSVKAATVATPAAAISIADPSVLAGVKQTVSLSSLFSVGASSADPAYLIVSGLDRDEYTKGYNTGAMGHLASGSTTSGFANFSGDGWSTRAVFTYQAATGQYVNASLGSLSQLVFDTGSNLGDTVTFTLFGTNNASIAASYASNPYVMIDNPSYFTDYGSVAVVTQATAATPPANATPANATPANATPGGIISAALSYVGDVWNNEGCWVLASDISAKAGATLPATSPLTSIAGIGNGEWFVAYNGPASASSSWVNNLTAGEIVSFVTRSGGGHITTVVSGQGTNAQLVDNITYVNGQGTITDSANDGSANDIIVQAPHAAMQEFSGVNPASVVVYQLDTPVVQASVAGLSLSTGMSVSLAGDFTASNPKAGQSVTEYQVYESNAADPLMISGVADKAAISAATACTLTSLSGLGLSANAAGSDTVDVRAYNGSYWGDWTALSVTVAAPTVVTVAAALASTGTSLLAVVDTAANIGGSADKLQTMAAAGRLASVTISAGSGPVPLQVAQLTSDSKLLALLPATGALSVSQATVAQAAAVQANAQVACYSITDTASDVSAALATLLPFAASGKLAAITISNLTSALTLTAAQLTSDAAVLAKIGGSYQLALSGATVATATGLAAQAHVTSVAITDSAANVTSGIASLETLAAAGKLGAITLSDNATPTLTLTAAQFTADSAALAKIVSPEKIDVTGATVAQAATLQASKLVTAFAIADTAADVTGLTALGADSKLTSMAITGTSGANTLNLTGIGASVTINLGGDGSTASGGLGAATMTFITPPDAITLGSGAAVITAGLTGSSGIETIANFQFGVDELLLNLGGLSAVSAFNTTYNGAHAIALTGGNLTEGVVLLGEPSSVTASSLLASHLHIANGGAMVT